MGAFERIARLVGRHWRASLAASLSLATGNTLFPPASAFDLLNLFGLFGSEEAPPVSADAVAYQLTFEGLAGDKDLLRALQDVSILHRLRQEPPPDGDEGFLQFIESGELKRQRVPADFVVDGCFRKAITVVACALA
jgi:translocation and assembly module TamA